MTDDLCVAATVLCAPGETSFDVLLLRPPDPDWREVDDVCIGPRAPRTPADLVPDIRDEFIEYLPPATPSFQPPGGAIVNLPTIFASGQPTSIGERTFDLAGFSIELEATPTWTWSFGDGESLTTTDPGGAWPNAGVTHTYTSADDSTVTLTTAWSGQFWVDGFGPFPVGGAPVTQASGPLSIDVREARSVLVAD